MKRERIVIAASILFIFLGVAGALNWESGSGSAGSLNPFKAIRGIFTNSANTSGLVVSNQQTDGAHGISNVGVDLSGEGILRLFNALLSAGAGNITDIVFQALNTSGATKTFAIIGMETQNVAPGSETGNIFVDLTTNGIINASHFLEITPTQLILDQLTSIKFPNGGTISIPSGSVAWKFPSTNPTSGQTAFLKVDNNGQMSITEAQPSLRTKAQLTALVPSVAGLMYYCSDCSTDGVVVSTGTGTGAFGRISARTTAIN